MKSSDADGENFGWLDWDFVYGERYKGGFDEIEYRRRGNRKECEFL
jgi:hypothetical protein